VRPLTIAVPKGRIIKTLAPLFERAGLDTAALLADDRRLIRESADGKYRFLLLKPDDVPTYVEYGTADLGVSGRDTLLERRYDLYQPLDLKVGQCRMVVATVAGAVVPELPRIATKFARIAREHFASKGVQAEVIYVQGSVELAPLVGLAERIVDLVQSGETLRVNGLVEVAEITRSTARVIVNRASMKTEHAAVNELVDEMKKALHAAPRGAQP